MCFRNRQHAGILLGEMLRAYREEKSVVVNALPRGGVPVAYEIARVLNAPLDIIITRKITHPLNPEYAVAAITEDGEVVISDLHPYVTEESWFDERLKGELHEALRRRSRYMLHTKKYALRGVCVILVDDGAVTGLTIRAAIQSVRNKQPEQIIVALPVAPEEIVEELQSEADRVVVYKTVSGLFGAVGSYYSDFSEVSDEEVITYLNGNS